MDRTPVYGTGGWRFESSRVYFYFIPPNATPNAYLLLIGSAVFCLGFLRNYGITSKETHNATSQRESSFLLPAQTLWSCRRTPQRQGLLPSKYGSPESQEEYQRLIQAWLATNQAQARIAAKGSLPSEELPLPSSFSPSSMSQLAELHLACSPGSDPLE